MYIYIYANYTSDHKFQFSYWLPVIVAAAAFLAIVALGAAVTAAIAVVADVALGAAVTTAATTEIWKI